MTLADHLFDLGVTLTTIASAQQRPSEFDLRQAEMRGLEICRQCGRELHNVSYSFDLLCSACEEKVGLDALS